MMFSVLWPFCASGSIFLQSLSGETKESNARPASSNISTALLLGTAAHTEVTASRAHHWVQNIFKSYFIIRLKLYHENQQHSWACGNQFYHIPTQDVLLTHFFSVETLINLTMVLGDELDPFDYRPFESTLSPSFVPRRRYSVSWVLHPWVN